jgi:hypothetical protein
MACSDHCVLIPQVTEVQRLALDLHPRQEPAGPLLSYPGSYCSRFLRVQNRLLLQNVVN